MMTAFSPSIEKTGRNAPCPCGSGKKYKACCSAKEGKSKPLGTPDLVALTSSARQAASQGNFEGAEQLFRQILSIQPNHAEALAGIGQSLCWKRRRRAGLEFLRKSARQLEREALKKKEIGLLTQLSEQLQFWGDIETALRLAQVAVRITPTSAAAQNHLSLCLGRVNRVEEALPPARRACELLPEEPGCHINLALLEARQGKLESARERLLRVLSHCRIPTQVSRATLELGVILDKLGDYDEAFSHFTQAAAIARELPEVQAVNAHQIYDSLATNRAGFDRNLLQRWSRADFRDDLPTPAFLFGFLRSGTTLTEQVLGAHPGILASDEEQFVPELSWELAKLTLIEDDVPAALRAISLDQARQLRKHYWQRVVEEHGEVALKRKFVDKAALNTIETGLIATLFPEAKILFALRDPRDVILSCFMQPFTATTATVNLLTWEGIARQYSTVMDYWLSLRETIQPAYFEVRYEDTVNDFEHTFRRVFELLEVEWRPEVIRFHEKAKGRYISTPSFSSVSQPLYQSAVARWHRYERHYGPVLSHLQRYIQAFGYADY